MTEIEKLAIPELKNVLRHRLAAWDAASAAERILGRDIDSQADGVDYLMAFIDTIEDVDKVPDAEVLKAFGIK